MVIKSSIKGNKIKLSCNYESMLRNIESKLPEQMNSKSQRKWTTTINTNYLKFYNKKNFTEKNSNCSAPIGQCKSTLKR